MLPSTIRASLNCSGRELIGIKHLRREISKTTTATNSDAISRQQTTEFNQIAPNKKLMQLNKYNNNRALSTIQTKVKPKFNSHIFVSKEESREFMAIFPDIVRDLTDAGRQTDIPEVTKRYAKVLQYNVPNGKKIRGVGLVAAYKMLEKPDNLTPENIRLANILGWCVELLDGFLLVTDDVLDGSEMRRGAPCWYKIEDVGLTAIYDAIFMQQAVYTILKRHFSNHHCYVPAMELFNDVTLKTSLGESLDCLFIEGGKPNLNLFTMDRFNALAKYKTAYYTFHLPTALAMYLANVFDTESHRQEKIIMTELGQFYQIQNDIWDCFGDPEITGKEGTDIREGKCTWLAVVALQRASVAQRKIMEEHYGRPEPESVTIIRNLYSELNLQNVYANYEKESFNLIRTHIQQLSKELPRKLLFKMMEKIYNRNC